LEDLDEVDRLRALYHDTERCDQLDCEIGIMRIQFEYFLRLLDAADESLFDSEGLFCPLSALYVTVLLLLSYHPCECRRRRHVVLQQELCCG